MAGHFIFARAWIGFSRSFPFERFNDLPDDRIVQALEEYCLNAYRLDLEVMGHIYKRRARFIDDHVFERLKEECDRGAIPEADPARLDRYAAKLLRGEPIPWIEEKSLSSPEDLIPEAKAAWNCRWAVEGRPQNPSEGFKIACWAGWVCPQYHVYEFGNWSPSDMLLLAEAPDAEIAAKAAEELQKGVYLAELIENIPFRFGHRPSAEISAARREYFRQTLKGRIERLNPLERVVVEQIAPLAQRIVGLLLQDGEPEQPLRLARPIADPQVSGEETLSPSNGSTAPHPDDDSHLGPRQTAGDWLTPPISLADMANRLGNIGRRKARSTLKQYGLKPAGNRQLWTVRLDEMPAEMVRMLKGRR
ncbi:MAG TPA: hypothetical protein PL151_19535 [Phycisphaerae bacterium]|nr:hypothetical protein [Phycisphaerae bacterium]HQE29950.1 hypothetical protein [Phycisphaerae bacterium]